MLFRNVQKLLKQNSQLRLFAMKSSTNFWFETCRFHDIVRWGIAKECQDAVVDQVPQLYDDFFIQGTPYYGKEHHLRAELTHPLSVDQNLPASSYGFVKGKHEYFHSQKML